MLTMAMLFTVHLTSPDCRAGIYLFQYQRKVLVAAPTWEIIVMAAPSSPALVHLSDERPEVSSQKAKF